MEDQFLIFALCCIFVGATLFASGALMTQQSMLVAYIFSGIVLGPFGLQIFNNLHYIQEIGDIGIIFLLFLLGLHLPPQKLQLMLKKVSLVGVISSFVFGMMGYGIGWMFHYSSMSCAVIGMSLMFSSTIIGLKLLPTTVLHHQHTGEVMIGILLFQDIAAILVLLILTGILGNQHLLTDFLVVFLGFPCLILVALLGERYVLRMLLFQFNRIKEYIFLLAIAWCLGLSELAAVMKLPSEIGAFIGGVALATSPIALYIAESLKPVRDFFLVLFFFEVGATFNLTYLTKNEVIWAALMLVLLIVTLKPVVYAVLLKMVQESRAVSWEVGIRLAQISEFSMIIAYVAKDLGLIPLDTTYLIQATTILSFVVSSYWVVRRYPTPVALSDRLRRD